MILRHFLSSFLPEKYKYKKINLKNLSGKKLYLDLTYSLPLKIPFSECPGLEMMSLKSRKKGSRSVPMESSSY